MDTSTRRQPTFDLTFKVIRKRLADGAAPLDIAIESRRRAAALDGEGVFLSLVPEGTIAAKAREAQARAERGESLPLLGLPFSVKDSIHVAGMTTTCNCPALALRPETSATVVQKLEQAGAILIGKNSLDQFATGLNGTRSPEPLCRNALDPRYIPGGSSSGSAVAVARDTVSFSLGTDTGGSGRVPAACNGIVGLKPSLGLVSTTGLVYNSRFFDSVPIFARSCTEAFEVLDAAKGDDPTDAFMRPDADTVSLAPSVPDGLNLAVLRDGDLTFWGDELAREAYLSDIQRLQRSGATLTEIDFGLFRTAGRHVFDTAMIAERLIAYGDVLARDPQAIHPAVRAALEPGLGYTAVQAFETIYTVQAQRREAARMLAPFHALVVPTIPTIFTIEAMLADPMAKNSAMGTYTYFVNPLDLCAVSIPGGGRRDGLPSALSIVATAAHDNVIHAIGLRAERLFAAK